MNVVLILIDVLKVDFTAWSNLTAVENHLVGKAIFGLVINHIGFSYIRPPNMILILISVFKEDFTAWSNLTAVENHLVRLPMVVLVVINIGLAHIRPLNVVFIIDERFKVVLPPGRIRPRSKTIWLERP